MSARAHARFTTIAGLAPALAAVAASMLVAGRPTRNARGPERTLTEQELACKRACANPQRAWPRAHADGPDEG